MNEAKLKELFISSLRRGHIYNNYLFPVSERFDNEVRIKEEGYFGKFDLVISVINRRQDSTIRFDSAEAYDNYSNLLMRTNMITEFARKEKCRADWITFFPVEIKSDDDVLDRRLANQVLDAILSFGRSVILLDQIHSNRAVKRGILQLIPATCIGYTGNDDYFEILSVFDRLIVNNIFSMSKRTLSKVLARGGVEEENKIDRIQRCLDMIQRITQKIAFNQFHSENLCITQDEVEFIQSLAMRNVASFPSKKRLMKLISESSNSKITEYF